MTRFFAGNKSGVGPVVKILGSDGDDPLTTPNANTGKYRFNSENQSVGYIRDIFPVDADFTTYPAAGGSVLSPNKYYLPSGSDKNTCQVYIACWQNGGRNFQQWFFYQSYFAAKYGYTFFPLVEARDCLDFTTNKFRGPWIDIAGNGVANGQIYSYTSTTSRTTIIQDSGFATLGRNRPAVIAGARFGLTDSNTAPFPSKRCLISVFDLPMHDEAIPNNATTPVAGQETIRINASMCRVALPGRTVADTDPLRYILHENRIPAKVMAAGIITVPALATRTITTRLPMTALTYMDFISKKSSESTFWHPPFIGSYSAHANDFTYSISGTTLTIVSACDVDMDIVYAIYADSGDAPTSGGSKVLLKGTDGVGDYVQVKRPGSSDASPALNDIMMDTRLSYLPLLKEGFLNWTADFPTVISPSSELFKGVRKANITVPNPDGLRLFPKVGAIYNLSPVASDYQEPTAVWNEHAVFVNNGTWQGQSTGYSTWANMLSGTSVDIFASNNNPETIQPTAAFFNSQLKGVRYYIFGIPSSL